MLSDSRIIVALDFPSASAAEKLYEQLDPGHCKVKVGKELFTRTGPALVQDLVSKGLRYSLISNFMISRIPLPRPARQPLS